MITRPPAFPDPRPMLGIRCWPVRLSDGSVQVQTKATARGGRGVKRDGEYSGPGEFNVQRGEDSDVIYVPQPSEEQLVAAGVLETPYDPTATGVFGWIPEYPTALETYCTCVVTISTRGPTGTYPTYSGGGFAVVITFGGTEAYNGTISPDSGTGLAVVEIELAISQLPPFLMTATVSGATPSYFEREATA